jgi:hypothetical protein
LTGAIANRIGAAWPRTRSLPKLTTGVTLPVSSPVSLRRSNAWPSASSLLIT